MSQGFSPASRMLLVSAALVIVLAGIKQAAPLLVPFLLSVFIALLCLPPMAMMQARGVSVPLSLLIVIIGVALVAMALAWLIGSSIDAFSQNLPHYQNRINALWGGVLANLQSSGILLPGNFASDTLDPSSAMKLVARILTGFGNVLANSFLIFLTVVFILLEAASFERKMQGIGLHGDDDCIRTEFVSRLRQYMSIKTTMSVITGALVSAMLWALGVDYPILWGVLAFMFNYVPNIGSIIAAVPAILLAAIQLDATIAVIVAAGYAVINIVVGNIIEPKFMGKGLGLSTLVVFLSLVFWGWILGPVGMLLSVPLTVSVKLALDSNPDTRWLGSLLGHA